MVSEIDAWDIKLLLAIKKLLIIGDPTLQHEFVTQLQKCRQNTSCCHLWENRSRRIFIKRDVEIRKYGLRCLGCMAITAGTTAQGRRVPGQDRAENV